MANSDKNPKEFLNDLANFMAEQVENMSDEEILEEASSCGNLAEATNLRKLMEERATKVAGERLAKARIGYEAAIAAQANCKRRAHPPLDELKQNLQDLFTRQSGMPLAAAWRNGEYQSEADLQSLWDELCDLGAIEDERK